MDIDAYLARIGLARADLGAPPSLEALRRLHRAHLFAVPFENSSVLRGEPITLEAGRLVAKIVAARRGGFCYELNGAFAQLLRALGFKVDLLSARVHDEGGKLGPPFDHMCLRVEADGHTWLADVGFGYSFLEPLRLHVGVEQADPVGRFRLVEVALEQEDRVERLRLVEVGVGSPAGSIELETLHRDGRWRPTYRFDLQPRLLSDYQATCDWQRTAPESPFRGGWLCDRALPAGYVTLRGRRLTVTAGGERDERDLADHETLANALDRWFGIGEPSAI